MQLEGMPQQTGGHDGTVTAVQKRVMSLRTASMSAPQKDKQEGSDQHHREVVLEPALRRAAQAAFFQWGWSMRLSGVHYEHRPNPT